MEIKIYKSRYSVDWWMLEIGDIGVALKESDINTLITQALQTEIGQKRLSLFINKTLNKHNEKH